MVLREVQSTVRCQKEASKIQYKFHLRPKSEQICLAVESSRDQLRCLRGPTGYTIAAGGLVDWEDSITKTSLSPFGA